MRDKLLFIPILIISILGSIYLGVLTRNSLKEHNYIGVSEEKRHSITINGEGEVIGTPDVVTIQLGLVTEKISIDEAQAENTKTMNEIIEKLKNEHNVEKKDMQSSNYNISPRYDWNGGKRELKGYTVSQNLNLKIRKMDRINEVLKLAGRHNLNQVNNLQFLIDDPEELRQEARIKAIQNAKEKAENLAEIMDVKLGKVLSFSESGGSPIYPIMKNYALAEDMTAGRGGEAPSIEAGSTNIKIYATVEYEIK